MQHEDIVVTLSQSRPARQNTAAEVAERCFLCFFIHKLNAKISVNHVLRLGSKLFLELMDFV